MRVWVHLGPFWVSAGRGHRRAASGSLLVALAKLVWYLLLLELAVLTAVLWLSVQMPVAAIWGARWLLCHYRGEPKPQFWAVPPLKVREV